MSARSAIYTILSEAFPDFKWYGSNAISETSDIVPPFGIIRMSGDADANIYNHPVPRLEIWIHDRYGSYMRIDHLLSEIRGVLAEVHDRREAGSTTVIAEIRWKSNSPDLIDDGFKTATRMCSFEVIGKDL